MDEEILTLTREQLAELKKRFLHSSMLQEKSYVRISDDKMEAWLYLAEPSEAEEKYKIDLTFTEYEILYLLASSPGKVYR